MSHSDCCVPPRNAILNQEPQGSDLIGNPSLVQLLEAAGGHSNLEVAFAIQHIFLSVEEWH